ncbi:MAG: hypothetical protein WC499_02575 [Patescibacteria group bacterium]
MSFKKCNKCDGRGHITDSPFPSYSGHSCDCEWGRKHLEKTIALQNGLCEICLGEGEVTYNAGMDSEYTQKCLCRLQEECDFSGVDNEDR